MVTPVRDGMNLVAKEFVACQVDDPGTPTILSAGQREHARQRLLRVIEATDAKMTEHREALDQLATAAEAATLRNHCSCFLSSVEVESALNSKYIASKRG